MHHIHRREEGARTLDGNDDIEGPNPVMMAFGCGASVAHLGQPAHSFVLVLGEARGVIQRHGCTYISNNIEGLPR